MSGFGNPLMSGFGNRYNGGDVSSPVPFTSKIPKYNVEKNADLLSLFNTLSEGLPPTLDAHNTGILYLRLAMAVIFHLKRTTSLAVGEPNFANILSFDLVNLIDFNL